MPTVGLTDGVVERLVLHLINASAIVSAAIGGGVSTVDELREKPARLLSVDDAGEGRVLARQTYAGMQHDGHQEARLAPCEAEVGDGLDALFELSSGAPRPGPDPTNDRRSAHSIRRDN